MLFARIDRAFSKNEDVKFSRQPAKMYFLNLHSCFLL